MSMGSLPGVPLSSEEWEESLQRMEQQNREQAQRAEEERLRGLAHEAAQNAAQHEQGPQGAPQSPESAPQPATMNTQGQIPIQVAPMVQGAVQGAMPMLGMAQQGTQPNPQAKAFATGLVAGIMVGGIAVMALRRAREAGAEG